MVMSIFCDIADSPCDLVCWLVVIVPVVPVKAVQGFEVVPQGVDLGGQLVGVVDEILEVLA